MGISAHERRQRRGDLVERKHEVHQSGTNGGRRHAEELRGPFILADDGPSHFLDRVQTLRPVAAGPGQHDRDHPIFEAGRHRFEQEIGRRAEKIDEFGSRQR